MLRPNRLLAKLRAGETCRGAWLFLGSPNVSEVLGLAGFDALIIDHEHTPGGIETAVQQIRAIQAAGASTILARVASNDPASIKLLLDAGVEGLLLPNVAGGEDARRFVAACRYPPRGVRGAHYTVSRAAHWGTQGERYYREAESELILIAMIESAAAADAIPELAAVDGLDMLFMGPLDLSGSIGRMGLLNHEDVTGLLRRAEQSTTHCGLLLGGAMVPEESAHDCFQRGYRFVTVGSDVGMLLAGARSSMHGDLN